MSGGEIYLMQGINVYYKFPYLFIVATNSRMFGFINRNMSALVANDLNVIALFSAVRFVIKHFNGSAVKPDEANSLLSSSNIF